MSYPVSIDDIATAVNQTAHDKGWYDGGERNPGEVIALMHSELSEALEEWRNGNMGTRIEEGGKPEGFYVELADCVIRIMDTFEEAGVSIGDVIRLKATYNKTRPYRHGGKIA